MIADSDHSVLEMDAASRLAIYVINHANSPLIAPCGDLSRLCLGFHNVQHIARQWYRIQPQHHNRLCGFDHFYAFAV